MGFSLALVDFDGTLADSMPYWLALPAETLRRAGLPEPPGFQELVRVRPMWEVAGFLTERYPRLEDGGPLPEQWYGMMEQNYLHRVALKPGARAFLTLLRESGARVWLLSATRQPLLDRAVEHFGLGPLLDRVLTEEEAGSKHTPAPYRYCAAAAGVSPAETVLAEDAPRNLAAAAALGLGTIAVRDESMARWAEEARRIAGLYLDDLRETDRIRAFLRENP